MTYQPSHRKPRWHDRPRAWLAAAAGFTLGWLRRDWYEEDRELADDNGEPIGDLFDGPSALEPCGRRITECIDDVCRSDNRCAWPPEGDRPVLRTAKVSGVHLPLSGGNVNPWINCAFTKDVPRPAVSAERSSGVAGPGYRQNVPRPGRSGQAAGSREWPTAGPGHLSMFDLAYVRSPWPSRPDTVIISAPRVCAGRIALLAGA